MDHRATWSARVYFGRKGITNKVGRIIVDVRDNNGDRTEAKVISVLSTQSEENDFSVRECNTLSYPQFIASQDLK